MLSSHRQKLRDRRKRLRALKLRRVQTRAQTFLAQARRQSQRVAASAHASTDQAFIDAVSAEP
jgi:hypothetical protein